MMDAVRKFSSTPFEYGQADCCTFVAECIKVLTGDDLLANLVYSSEAEAQSLIEQYGSLENAITAVLGKEPCDDCENCKVGLVELADGQRLAVFIHGTQCIGKTLTGVTSWPISRLVRTWCI